MPSSQDTTQLKQYLEGGIETVSLDFKGSHPLDKPALQELVKDIFAMANTRNGGAIIVGVDEIDGRFQNNGVETAHLALFKADELKDLVGRCASSVVAFSSKIIDLDGKTYILIQVTEFEEFPVICSCDQNKPAQLNGKPHTVSVFRPGDIFIRTQESRPATRLVQTHIETKELIELAVDKASRRLRERGWVPTGAQSVSALAKQGQDLLG